MKSTITRTMKQKCELNGKYQLHDEETPKSQPKLVMLNPLMKAITLWLIPMATPKILESTELARAIDMKLIPAVVETMLKPLQMIRKIQVKTRGRSLHQEINKIAGTSWKVRKTVDLITPKCCFSKGTMNK